MTEKWKTALREFRQNTLFVVPIALVAVFLARFVAGEPAGSFGFYIYVAVLVAVLCAIGTAMPYFFGAGDNE